MLGLYLPLKMLLKSANMTWVSNRELKRERAHNFNTRFDLFMFLLQLRNYKPNIKVTEPKESSENRKRLVRKIF